MQDAAVAHHAVKLSLCILLALLQVMEVVSEHLAQWSCSVAFPELAHVPLTALKRFIKTSSVDRFK